MAKSSGHDDYSSAMAHIDKNLKDINKTTDPAAWHLNAALGLLARAVQQDMAEMKAHLVSIDSKLSKLK